MSAFVAVTDAFLNERVTYHLRLLFGLDDAALAGARYHWIVDVDDLYTAVELADGTVINGTQPWTERDLSLAQMDMRGQGYVLETRRHRVLRRALARSRALSRSAAPKEATP